MSSRYSKKERKRMDRSIPETVHECKLEPFRGITSTKTGRGTKGVYDGASASRTRDGTTVGGHAVATPREAERATEESIHSVTTASNSVVGAKANVKGVSSPSKSVWGTEAFVYGATAAASPVRVTKSVDYTASDYPQKPNRTVVSAGASPKTVWGTEAVVYGVNAGASPVRATRSVDYAVADSSKKQNKTSFCVGSPSKTVWGTEAVVYGATAAASPVRATKSVDYTVADYSQKANRHVLSAGAFPKTVWGTEAVVYGTTAVASPLRATKSVYCTSADFPQTQNKTVYGAGAIPKAVWGTGSVIHRSAVSPNVRGNRSVVNNVDGISKTDVNSNAIIRSEAELFAATPHKTVLGTKAAVSAASCGASRPKTLKETVAVGNTATPEKGFYENKEAVSVKRESSLNRRTHSETGNTLSSETNGEATERTSIDEPVYRVVELLKKNLEFYRTHSGSYNEQSFQLSHFPKQ